MTQRRLADHTALAVLTMVRSCALGWRLRRCRNEAVATCVYCGRSFCHQHGVRLPDHHDVCSRRRCQAKLADLDVHTRYRAATAERNSEGLCGVQGCGHPPAGQCSKCDRSFCGQHLRQWSEEVRRGRLRVQRPVSTCGHCWRRRALWEQT